MFNNLPFALKNALLALGITAIIIGTVVYAINYLDHQRLTELNGIQDRLATDTLSLETQFSLLETAPCEDQASGTQLSKEVSDLGARLSQAEDRLGTKNAQVLELKKQYSLLQIRDYLLTKRLANTCHITPTVVLYFYSNVLGVCTDCDKASLALSYLHEKYPSLRVYAFDYNLDLGAVRTLVTVEKVAPTFPAFVINGKKSYGFTNLETFQKEFPKTLFASTTSSTLKKK